MMITINNAWYCSILNDESSQVGFGPKTWKWKGVATFESWEGIFLWPIVVCQVGLGFDMYAQHGPLLFSHGLRFCFKLHSCGRKTSATNQLKDTKSTDRNIFLHKFWNLFWWHPCKFEIESSVHSILVSFSGDKNLFGEREYSLCMMRSCDFENKMIQINQQKNGAQHLSQPPHVRRLYFVRSRRKTSNKIHVATWCSSNISLAISFGLRSPLIIVHL